MGRPPKYKEEYNDQAYKLCLLGHTDKELAQYFEVDISTITRWKQDYPDFCTSVKRGKEIADAEVAHSFYKRAKGYKYKEVTKEATKSSKKDSQDQSDDSEGEDIESIEKKLKVTKIITKEVPPDAGAALNWPKNRQPGKWRDKKEVEAKIKKEVDISKLSDDELERLEEILIKADPEADSGGEGEEELS